MSKIKSLAVLAALMTTLVITAAPASAEFKSSTLKASGLIKTFPATSTFQGVQGGPKIECKSLNGAGEKVAQGEWQVQVKTQNSQGKFSYQEPAITGPHELLKITKWGICVGPVSIAATVQCNLQVEIGGQRGNPATAENGTGSVYPPGCTVTIGTAGNTCTVNIQPDGNKELQGVTIKRVNAQEVEIKSLIEGKISSTIQESKELCKTLGIKAAQKEGHFETSGPLITAGQTLV